MFFILLSNAKSIEVSMSPIADAGEFGGLWKRPSQIDLASSVSSTHNFQSGYFYFQGLVAFYKQYFLKHR